MRTRIRRSLGRRETASIPHGWPFRVSLHGCGEGVQKLKYLAVYFVKPS
jgi:hypothetical protein